MRNRSFNALKISLFFFILIAIAIFIGIATYFIIGNDWAAIASGALSVFAVGIPLAYYIEIVYRRPHEISIPIPETNT